MFSLVSDGPSQLVLEQVNKYGVLRTVALSRSLFLSESSRAWIGWICCIDPGGATEVSEASGDSLIA